MKKLLPLLLLILIGCSEPEPKDINILNLDDNYHYYLDTKYSGVYFDKNNSDFYYIGQMSKGKYHGYFKKFDYEDNLIFETTFVNGFNTGPLVFYTKDGVSSIFEGDLEFKESLSFKYRDDKTSEWEYLWGDGIKIADDLSSDYNYRTRVDYNNKKWTSLVKISDSEENLYFGYYEPNVWIEEIYTQFSINNFNFEMGAEKFSDIFTDYLNKSDFKGFEDWKKSEIKFEEDFEKKYGYDRNDKIEIIKNMTFKKYREQEKPTGYRYLNNEKNFDEIKEIKLLEKDKFLIKTSRFENGLQNSESEAIWQKVVED